MPGQDPFGGPGYGFEDALFDLRAFQDRTQFGGFETMFLDHSFDEGIPRRFHRRRIDVHGPDGIRRHRQPDKHKPDGYGRKKCGHVANNLRLPWIAVSMPSPAMRVTMEVPP